MQAAHLFPGTVADNLRFGPRQHGQDLTPSEIDALLEQVGLEGFACSGCIVSVGGRSSTRFLGKDSGEPTGGIAAGRTDFSPG